MQRHRRLPGLVPDRPVCQDRLRPEVRQELRRGVPVEADVAEPSAPVSQQRVVEEDVGAGRAVYGLEPSLHLAEGPEAVVDVEVPRDGEFPGRPEEAVERVVARAARAFVALVPPLDGDCSSEVHAVVGRDGHAVEQHDGPHADAVGPCRDVQTRRLPRGHPARDAAITSIQDVAPVQAGSQQVLAERAPGPVAQPSMAGCVEAGCDGAAGQKHDEGVDPSRHHSHDMEQRH
mmetsp:Transcript_64526/g.181547  ORF Transcript_64526/g.181547 Transcript_64526/m.181547 type:complete len:232 (+) Transcript_64526:480-1175(+)